MFLTNSFDDDGMGFGPIGVIIGIAIALSLVGIARWRHTRKMRRIRNLPPSNERERRRHLRPLD